MLKLDIGSFQDSEKDSLQPYGEMGIVSLSGRAICYTTGLICRHYLDKMHFLQSFGVYFYDILTFFMTYSMILLWKGI